MVKSVYDVVGVGLTTITVPDTVPEGWTVVTAAMLPEVTYEVT